METTFTTAEETEVEEIVKKLEGTLTWEAKRPVSYTVQNAGEPYGGTFQLNSTVWPQEIIRPDTIYRNLVSQIITLLMNTEEVNGKALGLKVAKMAAITYESDIMEKPDGE